MAEMTPVAGGQVPVTVVGEPVIVQGIPIAMPQFGIDAVPLLDGATAGMLGAVNNFTVKQRVAWMEALTQGCIEQSNVYDIFDADNGNHIMVAVERSDDCPRCCCAPQVCPREPSEAVLEFRRALRRLPALLLRATALPPDRVQECLRDEPPGEPDEQERPRLAAHRHDHGAPRLP